VLLTRPYCGEQIKDERERTSGMYWREEKCIEEIYVGKTLQGRDHFGYYGVHESILLKWIKTGWKEVVRLYQGKDKDQ
jgi:hypothetical protein